MIEEYYLTKYRLNSTYLEDSNILLQRTILGFYGKQDFNPLSMQLLEEFGLSLEEFWQLSISQIKMFAKRLEDIFKQRKKENQQRMANQSKHDSQMKKMKNNQKMPKY